MFSFVISDFDVSKSPEEINEIVGAVLRDLELGDLSHMDIVNATSRGKPCNKVFIHYATSSPNAERFRSMLDDADRRQKEGESFKPVRIRYGTTREGHPRYWRVFKALTPEERLAKTPIKKFTPVIEYDF